ncbi:MAG: GNAT family N-acetyltransferase [Clostridia bacterium]|nr:GNAT family N-acetyltransferase [Clostridia bacterium]MBR4444024.1 GNAT family N-acetyltransferase [Clostridia bacterium]
MRKYVYYRIDSLEELKRYTACAVCDLDWHKDLAIIQKFYSRFTDEAINPDEFDQGIGNPQAIIIGDEIVSFAAPFSFREGETEIGAVATIPDQRNKGYCKALISEMAFRILDQGKAATLTTDQNNHPMRAAAKAIGMRQRDS